MNKKITRKGPGLSLAQKIGDQARSALYANKPDNWLLGKEPGDDFGYDFAVIAFDPKDEGAQCAFKIQLKGTVRSEARVADGEFLSVSFNISTLNLWHRSAFAVLVVIVDLIDTDNPKEAKVYYHLVNDELEDLLPTLPSGQKTVQLRVPTSQIVHKSLDILPIVLPYLDEITDARRAKRERQRAVGDATSEGVSIGAATPNASAQLSNEIVSGEIEALIEASSKRAELKAALTALRGGEYERVLELCSYPTKEACKTEPQDSAIVAHLRSMALDLVGDAEGADALTTLAEKLLPDCDDLVSAAAQKQLGEISFGDAGQDDREKLLRSLESRNGPSATGIKSKILALNGDFDRAREILKPFSPEIIAITEIVISNIEQAWDRVSSEVAAARKLPNLRPKQRLWLEVLEARAQFETAFQAVPRPTEGDFIVPPNGLPQVDYDKLRLAYESSRRAMLAAQRLNWPVDIKYVLDIFSISAMLLDVMTEAMPLMVNLGLARASVTPIRDVVAKMAVQYDQPEIALKLNERAGTSSPFEYEESVMAVATLKAGQITKALKFVTDDFLSNPSSTDVYLTSLLMLGMAADSALETVLLEKIRTRLELDEEARHYLAILDSFVLIQHSLLQRTEAIRKLHAYWSENGQPTVVGYNFITNSDPRSEDEAKLIVEVAENLEIENSLGNEHLADYSQALLTIDRADDAVTKLRSALARFQDDPKIKSLLGISLEIIGQSAEAFRLFEQLLNEGKASDSAQRYFVEIAVRMGFFDRAEQQVRAVYAKATDTRLKLRLLNTLFQLLLAEGKRPEQIEEVAWEYSRLANQSNEREEGIFLQEYFFATMHEDLTIKPERAEEFRRRLDAYTERFPASKYLWRANLPTEGPPEAMLAALNKAIGFTEDDVNKAKVTEQKMDSGALEVPFSWRPRRFLRNVSDLFMLWEIRKKAPIERAALHFRSSIEGYDRQVPQNIGECKAVLSLTSLLLLDELELLTFVLDSFTHLVVARATLIAFQEARSAFTSGWGRERAKCIMEELQKNFSKISHPPYGLDDTYPGAPDWYHEEKWAMQQPGSVYYSDDIVETCLVCGGGEGTPSKPSISTVDFLTWADKSADTISPHQVADVIGHMTRLRIMTVTVEQRYFIAAIPDDLNRVTGQAQAEAVLKNSLTYQSILNGVWHHSKPFDTLLKHFTANMVYLFNEGGANEEVLVSLWLRWLEVVRFQDKPNIAPLEKMLTAFMFILRDLKNEKRVVSRLWHSFWSALQRGFGSELTSPEDQVAIEGVGRMLGTKRTFKESEGGAAVLFEKAKMGLESGTKREEWLNNEYVDAVARQETANQESH